MRKEKKETRLVAVENEVQGYHEGGWNSSTNYAFLGYKNNLYFTSDRTIKLDNEFRPLDKNGCLDEKKILKGFGLEIELECWGINNQEALTQVLKNICMKDLPCDLFKYQRDGSLRGGNSSIEAITQVMTKEFIRNNYPNFKQMYELFKTFDISASRSGNCGMHVNMSNGLFGKDKKTQIDAIRKLIYIVNKHYDMMCVLVKRDSSRTGYCSRMYNFTNKDYAKKFDLETLGIESNSNHNICFNYAHFGKGRVELRLVGGQKDYYTLRNTMECIFHLVGRVKDISWDNCDSLTEIFKGCNKYVIKRLDDVKNAGLMDMATYNEIVANSDNETDFGNF